MFAWVLKSMCGALTAGAGSVWVHLKFVSWPDDPVQRQEHHETLRGPGIVIGRKVVESRSATQFPAAATFFCPRDVSVEKFLSSRFPQVLIDYDAAHSQHSIIALGNARHPEKLPTNRLLRRQEVCVLTALLINCTPTPANKSLCSQGGSWIMLPMDVPVPIMPGDEFAISPFFGFKVWMCVYLVSC